MQLSNNLQQPSCVQRIAVNIVNAISPLSDLVYRSACHMPLPSVRSLSTRLQRVQQLCMCILANGAEVAQSRTSRSLPAHLVPANPSTALVQAVHQGSAFPSARSSLLSRHRQLFARAQAVRIRFPQSRQLPSAPSLLRNQVENSRCQASSRVTTQRQQAIAFSVGNATASPVATLTDALQAQQKVTACLVGLASAIATLLFNPGASFASEVCQAETQSSDSNGRLHTKSECIAGIADLPGSFAEQADPVNPFTLFGNTRKQFLIENLEGSKVVSRKKGFTTKTCVSGVPTQQQTKQFKSLPLSAKADQADTQLCSKTTGPDLKQTCAASCSQACTAALKDYTDKDSKFTGYSINDKAKDKLSKACAKQCTYECAKPGDKYGFAIPFR